jgi:threonine/homoserine/homoserine lactone efflux protein
VSAAFLLTTLVVVATPGTGVLYTLAAGLSSGARAGVFAAAGCTLGIVPHLAAAATGAAALLHASGVAFELLKVLGVLYLLFMAWGTLREGGALPVPAGDRAPRPAPRIVVSGVLVNLLNPKLTIFAFAFLPQFAGPGPGSLARMLALGGVFMAVTFVVFAAYGVCAAAVRDRLVSRPRVMTWLRRVFAGTFVALGARLAAASR